MGPPLIADIHDFKRRDVTFEGKTRPVLITGETGPPVVVLHEIYGFTPTVARLCRWVREGGFRVYARGIHVLLTRSLFGGGIPRRWLPRVSLAKPTSAPVRC